MVADAGLAAPYGDRRGITYDWQWRTGARGTWYGTGDAWTIHKGACNYGYLYPDEPLGWDIAAMSDVNREYPDSCGLCYELACDNTWVPDNLGAWFDRTSACFDQSASVVVRVTDACAAGTVIILTCRSVWAFEKLAETKWGVIPLRYRPVPCDYKPGRQAKPIAHPSPGDSPPQGASRIARDWPEFMQDTTLKALSLYEDGYASGVSDASTKTWIQSQADSARSGAAGSAAVCGKVPIGGILAFRGWNGMFDKRKLVEFWLYVGNPGYEGKDQKTPDLWGGCKPSRVLNNKPTYYEPTYPYGTYYFWGWQVYLPVFAGWPDNSVTSQYSNFQGCGGNSVWDLNTVEFRNDGWSEQWVCVDRVRLA
ncbi:Expansin-A1 [Tetrabaena socialis]|uniref:Expansin-A1 n=1 Tax=Tetrabaena socialis TaxID=47790 RepID=A0A2J8A668_9CHLO|nr:Expansin-A1 [Tetrabaena socialis]|eukprot:PNH07993.1 Expansin-A1 [Tetrabaena socialis]